MTAAVEVRRLSKKYRVFDRPMTRLRAAVAPGTVRGGREFVALDDVSFALERGTALGVLGPNGAGKSTLLKVLGGIVEPTSGDVVLRGTVASIIELGAGFHPDFTGRQNALLNAEILGFTPAQALAAYDEIAAFCELGSYLDMPVRTYSSGMFVRLAFAVAVSARPDVLLVDEALAVGDAVFAHRCLGRIREMREAGVTIVFVSHDTNMILGVCDRAVYLDRGRLMADGAPKDVVHSYLLNVAERLTESSGEKGSVSRFHNVGAVEKDHGNGERRFGSFQASITEFAVEDGGGNPATTLASGRPARFRMRVRFDTVVADPVFGLMLKNRFGVEMFGTNTMLRQQATGRFGPGDAAEVVFELPLHLGAAVYSASFAVHTAAGHFFDYRVDAAVFEVTGVAETIGLLNLPTEVSVARIAGGGATGADGLREELHADAPGRLDMGPDALPFLEGDWHAAERDGDGWARWSGARASAFMRCPAAGGRVSVRFRALHPDIDGKPVTASLRVEDGPAVTEEVGDDAPRTLEADIPRSLWGRVIRVTVGTDRTWVPAECAPGSADTRALGLRATTLEVVPTA